MLTDSTMLGLGYDDCVEEQGIEDHPKKVDRYRAQLLVQFHEEKNGQCYLNPDHRWLLEVSTPTVHDRQQTYHRRQDNQCQYILEFEESRQCQGRAIPAYCLVT